MPTMTLDQREGATGNRLRLRAPNDACDPLAEVGADEFVDGILPEPPRSDPSIEPCANDLDGSTERPQESTTKVGPLIRLAPPATPRRRIDLLQQWEGVVTDSDREVVWAEIVDLTNPLNPSEIVELPLVEFAVSDQPLLSRGAVFYWSIGYETSPGGTLRRVSEIRVRRTAAWSQRNIDVLRDKARRLHEQFANNEGYATETR
jgi:hypothetical protein